MKLIKTNNDYELFDNEKLIASTKNKEVPDINFGILSEEDCKIIGFVDVNKLLLKEIQKIDNKLSLDILAYISQGAFIGFKTAQSLNDNTLNSKDVNHLEWILSRLINVHKENENYDYMIKFKSIIESLKQQTVFDVEVEMEDFIEEETGTEFKWVNKKLKIINNSVKIIKIL